jgi:hypothetical protein
VLCVSGGIPLKMPMETTQPHSSKLWRVKVLSELRIWEERCLESQSAAMETDQTETVPLTTSLAERFDDFLVAQQAFACTGSATIEEHSFRDSSSSSNSICGICVLRRENMRFPRYFNQTAALAVGLVSVSRQGSSHWDSEPFLG